MTFDLQEAGVSDLDELGAVIGRAYEQDPVMIQLMPGANQASQNAFWTAWLRADINKPGDKVFKITDTFTKVRYAAKHVEHADEDHGEFPEGTNTELMLYWFEQMDKYKDKHMDYEKDYFVNVLATLPEYHRKGLGSKLLNRFLDDADAVNAKTYIQATEMGAGLYPRFGWKDIEDLIMETPNGPVKWRCLMREPNSGRYGQ